MPRYFFHVNHKTLQIDNDGEELPDCRAAWKEATLTAGRIIQNIDEDLRPGQPWRLEVTDEFVNPLFETSVNAKLVGSLIALVRPRPYRSWRRHRHWPVGFRCCVHCRHSRLRRRVLGASSGRAFCSLSESLPVDQAVQRAGISRHASDSEALSRGQTSLNSVRAFCSCGPATRSRPAKAVVFGAAPKLHEGSSATTLSVNSKMKPCRG